MSIIVSGVVSVTHTHTGHNGEFSYPIEHLGYSEDEWLGMTDEERETFLDEVLDTEITNVLDCGIGWEKVDD